MRLGYAIDLHASAAERTEVRWPNLRAQAEAAEEEGLDLVVVPDHLYYAPGGRNGYARPDVPVGVWESVAVAGALAAATSRIGIGHSMVNTPYRPATMVANIAVTLDAVSLGRYSLGMGSGNSADYDELGIDASARIQRFTEALEVVAGMLAGGQIHLDGAHVTARGAELVLRERDQGPPLVVAANGPRTRRLAARFGDGWNAFAPIDDRHDAIVGAIEDMRRACEEVERDPATLDLTIDALVDPLDIEGRREQSRASLARLADLGVGEVRCYPTTDGTHASRLEAIVALPTLRPS
jgi:alkanesulfonate monooxygenase SsuD/methylene tetrahydromethanopterin reductase-like flavin-dependent oxidoreductase (luciferase family)